MLTKAELIELSEDLNKVEVQNGHINLDVREKIFNKIDKFISYDIINTDIASVDRQMFDFEYANRRLRITIDGMKAFVKQKRRNASGDQHKILDGLQKVLLECEEQWRNCSLNLRLKETYNKWYYDKQLYDFDIMLTADSILKIDIDNQFECYRNLINSIYALKYKIRITIL